jgi:hypothetical protein
MLFPKVFAMQVFVGRMAKARSSNITKKQAQVLEKAPQNSNVASIADMTDPEQLRGEAEAIRRALQLGRHYSTIEDEDEEGAFNKLVNPFDR